MEQPANSGADIPEGPVAIEDVPPKGCNGVLTVAALLAVCGVGWLGWTFFKDVFRGTTQSASTPNWTIVEEVLGNFRDSFIDPCLSENYTYDEILSGKYSVPATVFMGDLSEAEVRIYASAVSRQGDPVLKSFGSDSIVSLGFAFNPFGFKAEAGHGDGSFEVSLWCKTNDYSFSYDMMLPRMVEDEVPKITLLDHQSISPGKLFSLENLDCEDEFGGFDDTWIKEILDSIGGLFYSRAERYISADFRRSLEKCLNAEDKLNQTFIFTGFV